LKSDSGSVVTSLWKYFSSLKLTIFLLIGLAAVSIIGTVIPQGNPPPAEYLQTISQAKYDSYRMLGFFDMYHSWWFRFLLYLLTLNLVACTLRRLPHDWKTMTEIVPTLDDGREKSLANSHVWKLKGSVGDMRRAAAELLKTSFAAPLETKVNDEYHLFAQKGRFSRLGVYILHAGIIVVFIGAIIGSIFGFKGSVWINEGESVSAVLSSRDGTPLDLGFSVRCDAFSVSFYDTGAPKEFKSILTVVENGRTVIDKRPVIVNAPLTYKGMTFYQSSYSPASAPVFHLSARDRKSGAVSRITVAQGETVRLPNGESLRALDYTQDISPHIPQLAGPAVRLELLPKEGASRTFLLLRNYPDFDDMRGGEQLFSFDGIDEKWRTGLQVTRDPGVGIVWAGCILLVAGIFMAFFLSHRRIWVRIGGGRVIMAGSAGRNQGAFREFFDGLADKLKKL
jgi:cytochrome c biogenesis protein